MMMILLALLSAQDPADEAVTLARELRRRNAGVEDSEVRLRLAECIRLMVDRAGVALCGDPQDPAKPLLRFHEVRNLITRPPDRPCPDFLNWPGPGAGPLTGALDGIETRPSGAVDEEQLVDIVKEWTGSHHWEEDVSLEKTPNGMLLVHAPPALQQKVARVVRILEKERLVDYRSAFTLFASAQPLSPAADADGALTDEAWEKLDRQAAEGVSVRRLSSLEFTAQADQTASAFSGARRQAEGLPLSRLSEGFAVQTRALPSGDRIDFDARASWTKALPTDEVATASGTLRLPRIAEAAFSERRSLPPGKRVLLGTAGPLPPDAGPLPHLTLVVRVSRVNP